MQPLAHNVPNHRAATGDLQVQKTPGFAAPVHLIVIRFFSASSVLLGPLPPLREHHFELVDNLLAALGVQRMHYLRFSKV